jgi:hypothetical protein
MGCNDTCILRVSQVLIPRKSPPNQEFTERLTVAIWRANGSYCGVLVTAAYLEIEPPTEEHQLDESDYERLMAVPAGISYEQLR